MAGDIKGFLKVKRMPTDYRSVAERVKDFKEVIKLRSDDDSKVQASRCMDCGVPFCHWGCPIGNVIPEWNELLYHGKWRQAFDLLNATNIMPEVTGRICPAPCEYSCVLGINDDPVTIRENELSIIEYAFREGLVKPIPPKIRTGKKVAVIGSGPAGIAAASQLNKAGHSVVLYERDKKIGGILRYGIPDFKLEKNIVDRRIALIEQEGVVYKTNTYVGVTVHTDDLLKEFDAVCLTGGSRVPRDLVIEGRYLKGIHFAMDYLAQSNVRVTGDVTLEQELLDAKGKHVVVIGGGDTGSDCIGTAHRQGAANVVQIELMPKPPKCRTGAYPWPYYPLLYKSSSSHQEGGERDWCILTKKFIGENEHVQKLVCQRVAFESDNENTCPAMKEIPDSTFEITADLVILAIGFLHPEHKGVVADLKLALDQRGNVKTDRTYMTSYNGVFCAGDMRRGQSLIVWAINEGRNAAHYIDVFLTGKSSLPVV